MKYYVYFLLDPRKFYLPFYVGKGTGNRARHHLTDWQKNTENRFKKSVIEAIRKAGMEPKIFIFAEFDSEEDAYRVEEEQIARFGRRSTKTGILTNICSSQRPPTKLGHPMSQETKDKISLANKGKKRSPEISAKLSAQRKGRPHKSPSEETKKKIRDSNLGIKKRKWTDEEKAAHSIRMTEMWKNPEVRKKVSIAAERRRISKEEQDE